MVVDACHPSYTGSRNRRIKVHISRGINVTAYPKNNDSRKGWGVWLKWDGTRPRSKLQYGADRMAQVAERLPSKSEVLSSNSTSTNRKKKEKKRHPLVSSNGTFERKFLVNLSNIVPK
jgi:hypothetical protein